MRLFVCSEMISNITYNVEKIKKTLTIISDENCEPYFIYVFALFESSCTEVIRHLYSSFPEKLSTDGDFNINRGIFCNNIYSPFHLLDTIVNNKVMKISKGNIVSLVKNLEDVAGVRCEFDVKLMNEITSARNIITHQNTISNKEYLVETWGKKKNILSSLNAKEYINYILKIITDIVEKLIIKYSKYTRLKLVKDFWSDIFSTPLLPFDKCIKVVDNCFNADKKQISFNIEYLKHIVKSLCRSEKLLLIILMKQYNNTISSDLFSLEDIPMLASISDKDELIKVIHVFSIYPHLFNGMEMETINET